MRLPRTRGDGPDSESVRRPPSQASPHTRGWTLGCTARGAGRRGFPAHAGMDPCVSTAPGIGSWLPRTRGDGPPPGHRCPTMSMASPHTRGWTPNSPYVRPLERGFPAHAGMDPGRWRRCRRRPGLPRTRGDGPLQVAAGQVRAAASPHTRGWTLMGASLPLAAGGFPAHAGMDLSHLASASVPMRLPRTRGDGPPAASRIRATSAASPHTRGWTPGTRGTRTPARWLPRTRGDGPGPALLSPVRFRASPHTRGWTPSRP